MATQQFGIRLPEELVARLDAHVERMKAAQPGLEVTRADAVRVLLMAGLETVEGPAQKRGAGAAAARPTRRGR